VIQLTTSYIDVTRTARKKGRGKRKGEGEKKEKKMIQKITSETRALYIPACSYVARARARTPSRSSPPTLPHDEKPQLQRATSRVVPLHFPLFPNLHAATRPDPRVLHALHTSDGCAYFNRATSLRSPLSPSGARRGRITWQNSSVLVVSRRRPRDAAALIY